MSKQLRSILTAVGVVLLLGTPLAWWAGQPATDVGDIPTVGDGSDTTEPPTAAVDQEATDQPPADRNETPAASATASSVAPGAAVPSEDAADPATRTTSEAFVPTPRPALPVSVAIPSIGVSTATVVEVGLDANRAVAIPDDVREVGWYGRGPRPGEAGNAFMTSHVDSRTQGRGVLFDLRRTQPGDPITVTHADGSTSEWVVVARERIDKGAYPMDRVFRFDGPPGLVIDTCGGAFNPSTGSYENIDIVYAQPAQ